MNRDNSWIAATCSRVSRNQLAAWLAGCLVVLVLAATQTRYILNFIGGPYEVSIAQLNSINDLDRENQYFVRLSGAPFTDTGIEQLSIKTQNGREVSRTVTAKYYCLQLDSKCLVLKASQSPSSNVEGALTKIPASLLTELTTGTNPYLTSALFPFYLEADEFRVPGYWALGALACFLCGLAYYAAPSMANFLDPTAHPLAKKISAWGEINDVSKDIGTQLSGSVTKIPGLTLTDDYLVSEGVFSADVNRFWDLIWFYKKIITKKVYFVIPAGKEYGVIMVFYGASMEKSLSEKHVDQVLASARHRAPWAFAGYSREAEDLFQKQQDLFCRGVEERRTQILKRHGL